MADRLPARITDANRLLGWLTRPGDAVCTASRPVLLGELLAAPAAIIMGALSGLLITAVALIRTGQAGYAAFGAFELALLVSRIAAIRRVGALRRAGRVPSIDASVMLSIAWCALQGLLAYSLMTCGDLELMVVAATMVMGLIGPICARNYAAPRLAALLVALCMLPFLAGALASGITLLWMVIPMAVLFLAGMGRIVRSFHATLVRTLEAEAQNRFYAHHDALTGLLNRFGLDERLAALPRDPDHAMAVLCIDLDGFKQVNDRLGHAAGDRLLEQVAERLRSAVREEDLIARLGGDEFLILVRNMPPLDVGALAERLIARITRLPYAVADAPPARIGASIGYACCPEDATTTAALRARADQALYAAKASGRGIGRRFAAPEGHGRAVAYSSP